MLHVGFCRLSSMMRRMLKVAMGRVGVVGRLLVVPRVIVLRGLAMMPRRVLMVFRCLPMVFCCLFRHKRSSVSNLAGEMPFRPAPRGQYHSLKSQQQRWRARGRTKMQSPNMEPKRVPMGGQEIMNS
jgi:hypothetical protein